MGFDSCPTANTRAKAQQPYTRKSPEARRSLNFAPGEGDSSPLFEMPSSKDGRNAARLSCSHVVAGRFLFGRVPRKALRSSVVAWCNRTRGALTPTPNRCKTIGELNDAVKGHGAGGTVKRSQAATRKAREFYVICANFLTPRKCDAKPPKFIAPTLC